MFFLSMISRKYSPTARDVPPAPDWKLNPSFIIPAVSQMIDSEDTDGLTVTHADRTYNLRRINFKGADAVEKNNIILVFEDLVE